MPRDQQSLLFVGIKNAVVALDDKTGLQVWRAELRSSDYVTVLWNGEALFAANSGEVWRLDAATGAAVWHNDLKGLGRGLVSLASSKSPIATAGVDMAMEKRRRDAQAAAQAAG